MYRCRWLSCNCTKCQLTRRRRDVMKKQVRGKFPNGPFTPNHIGWPSDGHRIAIGWTFYKMGSVPNFFNGWNLFLKDSINEHRFESFYAHFILFLLCCVIYFPLLTWHFQSSLNLISILSASDVCECCIVLYRNPFCPMAIRCPSDEKYFWCEGAIRQLIKYLIQTLN